MASRSCCTTTDGHGVAGDAPWHALSQLDAGSWHSRAYAGESLPTLQALARWCLANGHIVNMEIKPTPGLERRTGEVVAAQVRRLWSGSAPPPLLTSFQPQALQGARAIAPELPRGLLFETLDSDWRALAWSLGCVALVCHHVLWDAALVVMAREAGLRCLSYTVNDEWAARRLIALGMDGLITDRIDFFVPDEKQPA